MVIFKACTDFFRMPDWVLGAEKHMDGREDGELLMAPRKGMQTALVIGTAATSKKGMRAAEQGILWRNC